jgi:ankyrin repeat protein
MKAVSVYDLARAGDLPGLKKLVKKHGREILLGKDEVFDQTCLHLASEQGRYDVVAWLLQDKHKVPVNPIDKNGWAPLHSAATQGRLDICELLLNHGAFAPARTSEGTSALHYLSRVDVALRKDQFRKVVQGMLQGGADLNGQNRHGLTPLHEAALRGNVSVVQVLLEFDGLALDTKTAQSGETALVYAARANYPNILNLLLDAGANANIAGTEGTALDVAVSLNRREAAKALRARVKDPCKLCGRPFFALCFHVEAPRIWAKFTDEQKQHRNMRLSADLCQAHEDVFIRGVIEIPIISSNATAEIAARFRNDRRHQPGQLFLSFGVFVQVSKASFEDYVKHWNTAGREQLFEPIDGFVANVLPHWKSTFNTPCKLIVQAPGCRPSIKLEDSSHPLCIAQIEGIPFSLSVKIQSAT